MNNYFQSLGTLHRIITLEAKKFLNNNANIFRVNILELLAEWLQNVRKYGLLYPNHNPRKMLLDLANLEASHAIAEKITNYAPLAKSTPSKINLMLQC